jgi:hypothetical protein
MVIQRRRKGSKAENPVVSAIMLLMFLSSKELYFPFPSFSGLHKQLSYCWLWPFGVLDTLYAAFTSQVLGPIYRILSCYDAV